jgi:hypothetical protein
MDYAKCILTAEKNKQNSATTLGETPAASQLSFIIVHLTKFDQMSRAYRYTDESVVS